ncbi:MAG: UvrD-helicase domain-containing protein, partial [Desulfobacteraceae bacterium]|nr:UvrD-helicase domain-containing protein [Desulfobacteraceae bacterium]
TDYIFAVETGLSSDPLMNWRVKCLDGLTLISNSDAHSPMKLGREANLFNTSLSYSSIKSALKKSDPEQFLGTFEFYPEEGKYHIDGHRKCGVSMVPRETNKCNGVCPVCKKPLTIGVLNRVEALAERNEGEKPDNTSPYHHLIPLDDLLSEILKVGPKSKKVTRTYHGLLEKLGPEFDILHRIKQEVIEKAGIPLLGEAITRMREKRVNFSPGFDGEFGKVKIFNDEERQKLLGVKVLFKDFGKNKKEHKKKPIKSGFKHLKPEQKKDKKALKIKLNPQQMSVVMHQKGPILIKAGPGTGKTRTITHRISALVENGVSPDHILAVTFTNKAALEMKERLSVIMGGREKKPVVGTFHSLCLSFLKDLNPQKKSGVIDDELRNELLKDAICLCKKKFGMKSVPSFKDILNCIVSAKQQLIDASGPLHTISNGMDPAFLSSVYRQYQDILTQQHFYDYEDLIFQVVHCLEKEGSIQKQYQQQYSHIFVDEFQDINMGQYRLIRAISKNPSNTTVIGDPDQSIYGFRGSNIRFFDQFKKDYQHTASFSLLKNYRSTETILKSSFQMMHGSGLKSIGSEPVYSDIHGPGKISIFKNDTEKAEAVAIGKTIEKMMGGTGFHSIDFGKTQGNGDELGFSDFAVLFRTNEQGRIIFDILEKAGISCRFVNRASVMDQQNIKQLVSLLKIIEEKGCFSDIEKILSLVKPSISKSVFEKFKLWSYEKKIGLDEAIKIAYRLPVPVLAHHQQKKLFYFLKALLDLKKKYVGLPVPEKVDLIQKEILIPSSSGNKTLFMDAVNIIKNIALEEKSNTMDFFSFLALQKDTDIFDKKIEKVSL